MKIDMGIPSRPHLSEQYDKRAQKPADRMWARYAFLGLDLVAATGLMVLSVMAAWANHYDKATYLLVLSLMLSWEDYKHEHLQNTRRPGSESAPVRDQALSRVHAHATDPHCGHRSLR